MGLELGKLEQLYFN